MTARQPSYYYITVKEREGPDCDVRGRYECTCTLVFNDTLGGILAIRAAGSTVEIWGHSVPPFVAFWNGS